MTQRVRERPVVRSIAAVLAAASLWAAFQGPLDGSKLALAVNWAEVVVGIVLALVAIGVRLPTRRT